MRRSRFGPLWLVLALLLPLTSSRALAFGRTGDPGAKPVAQEAVPYAVPAPSEPWERRLLHPYRATIALPASWRFNIDNHRFYDPSGQLGLELSLPIVGAGMPLEARCVIVANRLNGTYSMRSASQGEPIACLVDAPGREWNVALLRHGDPYESPTAGRIDALLWTAHRDVLPHIVDSVSFAPPSAEFYLAETLRVFEDSHIFADEIDWPTLREKALATLPADGTYEDAHEVIRSIVADYLDPLDHGHGQFMTPDAAINQAEGNLLGRGYQSVSVGPTQKRIVTLVYPDSPADRAGLRPGDVLLSVEGQLFADWQRMLDQNPNLSLPDTYTYQVQRPGEAGVFDVEMGIDEFEWTLPVTGRRLGDIAYVELFSVDSLPVDFAIAYATDAHRTLAALDSPAACGWIVDVRRNTGGDVVTMALTAAPLWGEGVFMRHRDVRGTVSLWSYADGRVINDTTPWGNEIFIEEPYELRNANAPVAILLSQLSASMAEVTARAIMHRPDAATRTFGEQTTGWDGTLLSYFRLYDQARLDFSILVLLDPNGEPIRDPITPDVPMTVDYSVYGTDADPMIQAAVEWLNEQPACSG